MVVDWSSFSSNLALSCRQTSRSAKVNKLTIKIYFLIISHLLVSFEDPKSAKYFIWSLFVKICTKNWKLVPPELGLRVKRTSLIKLKGNLPQKTDIYIGIFSLAKISLKSTSGRA